jgi:hypothetical protein
MQTFDASEFYRATAILRRVIGFIENIEKFNVQPTQTVSDADQTNLVSLLGAAQEHFDVLQARVTAIAAKEILEDLENTTYESLGRSLVELDNTLRRELQLTRLIVLHRGELGYYEPENPPFGDLFDIFFPSASYELEEACKCLALGRYTAAVFHLMRLMEIALNAVRLCLDIPDPVREAERNWGKILESVKKALDQRNVRPDGWPDPADKALFREMYVSLDAVRVAWRNATMHVENKYTAEEAEHIFGAVRGLVQKIAARMNEDGEVHVDQMGDVDQPELDLEVPAADAAADEAANKPKPSLADLLDEVQRQRPTLDDVVKAFGGEGEG